MAALLVLGLPIVAGGPDILMLITQKQRDMLGVVSLTDPGSYITATPLAPTLFSFLQQAPLALHMTFLSQFATGDLGGLGLLSALENMVMVVLLPVAALRARPWARIDLPLLLYFVSFISETGSSPRVRGTRDEIRLMEVALTLGHLCDAVVDHRRRVRHL